VPEDFDASDSATDQAVVERAKQLSDQLQKTPQPSGISASAATKLEAQLNRQVEFYLELGRKYSNPQRLIASLQKERDAFGARSGIDQR